MPEVWVSDRDAAQATAIDEADTVFAPGVTGLLRRARAIGRLRHDRGDLERRLDRLLATRPTKKVAHTLWQALCRPRDDLFRFLTRRNVPDTNTASEPASLSGHRQTAEIKQDCYCCHFLRQRTAARRRICEVILAVFAAISLLTPHLHILDKAGTLTTLTNQESMDSCLIVPD